MIAATRSLVIFWLAAGFFAGTAPSAQVRRPIPLPDPAADPVRVELRLTTHARFASVRVLGGRFAAADGRRLAGPPDLRTAVLENLLPLSGNVEGSPATGVWRIVLTGARPGTQVGWLLNVQPGHHATIEIFNANDEQRPRLVDRFEGVSGSVFTTGLDQLRADGPLVAPARRPPLVLGHYYPWFERTTWSDPRMLDQPLRLYSTDDAGDVRRQIAEAKRAGLDGVTVSWQGPEAGGGWNHRRMLLVLQAAQEVGVRASILVETLVANRGHVEGAPVDPEVALEWLTALVDLYGSHPAYLRVDGRPVVFIYAWGFGGEVTWRTVLDRLRAGGRNPFVLADSTDPAVLGASEGLFTYAANLFAQDIGLFSRRLAVAGRSHHHLGAAYGPPRLAMATVSPGYDESLLHDRPLARVVDRRDGAFYDAQWRAALESGADWVLVTSWNEWWENTHIDPSQRYGEAYLWRTRYWSNFFKAAPRE